MDTERVEKKIVRLIAKAEELETLAREFRNRAKVFREQADDMRKCLEQQNE